MKKYFLHEHLLDAASWNMLEIRELEADPQVYKVTGPMCRFEMKARDDYGVQGLVRKETKHITSSLERAKILEGRCDNHVAGKIHTGMCIS